WSRWAKKPQNARNATKVMQRCGAMTRANVGLWEGEAKIFFPDVRCVTQRSKEIQLQATSKLCASRTGGPKHGELPMRGRDIRLVVAFGVALVGISAIGSVIAYSAVTWIAQENVTKPLPRTPAESRVSDQQQLRQIFKPFRSLVSGR